MKGTPFHRYMVGSVIALVLGFAVSVSGALAPEFPLQNPEIFLTSAVAFDPMAATLEGSTFAPNIDAAPGIAADDPAFSARAAIIPIVNAQTGVDNPDRQGLVSAILGEGSPLNVTVIHPHHRGKVPTDSPLWDVHPARCPEAAIAAGARVLVNHHEEIARLEPPDPPGPAPGCPGFSLDTRRRPAGYSAAIRGTRGGSPGSSRWDCPVWLRRPRGSEEARKSGDPEKQILIT